jgi:hypothetical protein
MLCDEDDRGSPDPSAGEEGMGPDTTRGASSAARLASSAALAWRRFSAMIACVDVVARFVGAGRAGGAAALDNAGAGTAGAAAAPDPFAAGAEMAAAR